MFSKDVPPYDFFELTEFFSFACSKISLFSLLSIFLTWSKFKSSRDKFNFSAELTIFEVIF